LSNTRENSIGFSDSGFVQKLKEITETNLSDEHFGVNELVEQVGLSHSQIHRRLKAITGQSVSCFVRKLRLDKAKGILEHEKYTVAEVAYKVGFGSPSYFIKCFHDHFGYTPGDVKKHLYVKTEDTGRVTSYLQRLRTGRLSATLSIKNSIALMVGIIVIVVCSFFAYWYFTGEKAGTGAVISNKTLAVLPLKNRTNDSKNNYLADGIMEDITNRLSHISEIEVRSVISSNRFRNSTKPISMMVKELGVAYILDGSMFKEGDRIRIIVQLVEINTDKILWSGSYEHELTDVFDFVSSVSKKIADKLNTVLSKDEVIQIEKRYTENIEAYNLYLQGRFFWQRRTKEDIDRSIDYFNRALKSDSTYALAYAGLADSYYILTWWEYYPYIEGYSKSKEYLIQALHIDNDLPEAHATLGAVACWYDHNWELVNKELNKAIQLNPNYATAHQYYSEYLDNLGKRYEARKYIDQALELNPNSVIMYWSSSLYYYHDRNYSESLSIGGKVLEIDKNFEKQYWLNFKSYINLKKDVEAIAELQKVIALYTPALNSEDLLLQIYSESGIYGVILWAINWELRKKNPYDYRVASLYSLVGEKELAIKILENMLEEGHSVLLRINCNPDFQLLHNDSRFIALLKKMNLPDN